jgi:UDP-glucose 4-epimerase
MGAVAEEGTRAMSQLQKVVITGGAGFIGANLGRHLTESGAAASVVAYDNLSSGLATNLDDLAGVELVEGDILDLASLTGALAGADAVVHLAARPAVP